MRPGRTGFAGAVAVRFRVGRLAFCLVTVGRATRGVVGGVDVSVVALADVTARCRRVGRVELEERVPYVLVLGSEAGAESRGAVSVSFLVFEELERRIGVGMPKSSSNEVAVIFVLGGAMGADQEFGRWYRVASLGGLQRRMRSSRKS